ncbi:MAG: DNA repair protein RecO [Myxococcales bacterium]|jgi:DNA repair protein RecO (recombination protein O)|nr:DNA repair protein RecO [Myxococcales bacterium]
MERFSCTALILSRIDFGESDRILTLLTEERGKLSAFARGARKSRRRFVGVLEPFSLIQANLRSARGALHTLEEASLVDGFDALRRDLGAMSRAAYACELARELCRDHAASPEFFSLLRAFLGGSVDPVELMRFELGALSLSGLRPHLDHCVQCGAADSGSVELDSRFDPERGGRLCGRCARSRGTRISNVTLGVLAALQTGVTEGHGALEAPAWVRAEARAALTGFVVHHMGHRLKSYDFMRDIGLDA